MTAKEASEGHLEFCKKYDKIAVERVKNEENSKEDGRAGGNDDALRSDRVR